MTEPKSLQEMIESISYGKRFSTRTRFGMCLILRDVQRMIARKIRVVETALKYAYDGKMGHTFCDLTAQLVTLKEILGIDLEKFEEEERLRKKKK